VLKTYQSKEITILMNDDISETYINRLGHGKATLVVWRKNKIRKE
jgi:hypothetical protein